ncbi:GNAT family N-acetyltransferase [Mesorhizobium sp.]|uniref:GNAT family N-acetyltransferase n=1 Tax=Mesorhizobium sp. TaxID=1871066 RepID=UPI00257BE2F3|nr:GNAT family N-acetyltransferase [Mesorhizobium sp.]
MGRNPVRANFGYKTLLTIRGAAPADADAIWKILEPVLRAGETYALPPDWSRSKTLSYWFSPNHEVFVAEMNELVMGTYFLQANQLGGGAHVANCGYVTAQNSIGRGVATAMCQHSLRYATERGFRAMQFNCVVSSNERAVKLWRHLGFEIIGTIPQGFEHPILGFVDALIMHRAL